MEPYREDVSEESQNIEDNVFYRKIPLNDTTPYRRKVCSWKFVLPFVLGTTFVALLVTVLAQGKFMQKTGLTATPSTLHKSQRNCEGGPEKATAAGCVFDVMTARWTPPECFNRELSRNASESIKRPIFYRGANLLEPISDTDDPWTLRHWDEGWTYTDYHVVHCRYVLQLAAEAAGNWAHGKTGFLLNSLSSDVEHTSHCMWVLENQEENKFRPSASHDPAKTGVKCISMKN